MDTQARLGIHRYAASQLNSHHLDQLLNSVGGLFEEGAFAFAEFDFDDLLDALRAEFDGDAYEEAVDAVLALQVGGTGHNHLLVEQDRVDHLQDRGGGREVGAARAEQFDDFRATIAGALYNLFDAFGWHQLRDGYAGHGTHTRQWHHRIAMPAEHIGLHIAHRRAQFLCDEGAETSGIQHTRHADHAVARKDADVVRQLGHRVKRIRDHDDDAVGRVLHYLLRYLSDDFLIFLDKVVAAHAWFAREA